MEDLFQKMEFLYKRKEEIKEEITWLRYQLDLLMSEIKYLEEKKEI